MHRSHIHGPPPVSEPNPVRIRPARAAEAASIGALSVFAYMHGGHLQADDSYAATLRDVASRLAQTFVAVDAGDRVIGAVTICTFGDDHAELASPSEGEFRFLAIDPGSWGRGVGTALVAFAEGNLHARGFDTVVIRVISLNTRAQRLYERLGYLRTPERDVVIGSSQTACGVSDVTLQAYRKDLALSPTDA